MTGLWIGYAIISFLYVNEARRRAKAERVAGELAENPLPKYVEVGR